MVRIEEIERRIKKLKISEEDEVSYSLDGNFVTSPMKRYLNCLRQGRNVSVYHLVKGRPERCVAKYMQVIDELLNQENEELQREESK